MRARQVLQTPAQSNPAFWQSLRLIYDSIDFKLRMFLHRQQQQRRRMQMDHFVIDHNYRSKEEQTRNTSSKAKRQKKFLWSQEEHELYVQLLEKHREWIEDTEQRKTRRVYCLMAKFITSRTSVQIKTHHQKMMTKYGDVKGIIKASQPKQQVSLSLVKKVPHPELEQASTQQFEGTPKKENGNPVFDLLLFKGLWQAQEYFQQDLFENYHCHIEYGDEIFDLL